MYFFFYDNDNHLHDGRILTGEKSFIRPQIDEIFRQVYFKVKSCLLISLYAETKTEEKNLIISNTLKIQKN